MTTRKWIVGLTVTFALGSVGVAACGGDDTLAPGGTDASVLGDGPSPIDATPAGDSTAPLDAGADAALAAQTAACNAVVDAVCTKLTACLPPTFTSPCAVMHASCPGPLFGAGSNMTVAQANACAAQIAAVPSCQEIALDITGPENFFASPPLRLFPACEVPGSRGAGDSCESNAQCSSLFCSSPENNWAVAVTGTGLNGRCGTCAGVYGPDDNCTTAGPAFISGMICPSGQACDPTTERCRTLNAGDPCVGSLCAPGDTCVPNPDGGTISICASQAAVGAQCANGSPPCAGNGYCVFGDDAKDDGGTCAAVVPVGGKCTPSTRANPTCAFGSFCIDTDGGADSYCTVLPGDGQPCLNGTVCTPPNTICDNRVVGKEICRKPAANGTPCADVAQTYADGGPTGSTTSTLCAGECSSSCSTLDAGPTAVCIGGMLGGQVGEVCGTDVCTTCAPGLNCVSGKCATATLHCE